MIRREAPPASSSFLASRKAPSLKGVRFAVLALGDSTCEFFCEAGRFLDRRLEELGASRLLDRRDCDVDYETDVGQWLDQVLAKLQQQSAPASPSASADFATDEAHLCVAPVRYALHGGEPGGVASLLLADSKPGDRVPVYVNRNDHFRLPRQASTPIVMVGAGTGVAPYRAYLQHREAAGIDGRSWLFFGERSFRSDFLYQLEWQEWLRSGVLSRLDLAFSRDGADKVYVQHRLQEQAADPYRRIADGAHVCVCGDAARMARDVHETLLSVIAAQARRGREAAEEYLREMQAQGRYQRDVY